MELKNRVVIISEKNMDNINDLYGKCTTDELDRIVNNMIDTAVTEINEDRNRLHMGEIVSCAECEFMKMYDYGNRIYYCDHENRIDEMGKLSVDNSPETCPEWCPLRCKNDNNIDSDLIKMESDIHLTDKKGNPIEVKVPKPEYIPEIFFTKNGR